MAVSTWDPILEGSGDSVTTESSGTQPEKGSSVALCLFSLFLNECTGFIENHLFSLQLPFEACVAGSMGLLRAFHHAELLRQSCLL